MCVSASFNLCCEPLGAVLRQTKRLVDGPERTVFLRTRFASLGMKPGGMRFARMWTASRKGKREAHNTGLSSRASEERAGRRAGGVAMGMGTEAGLFTQSCGRGAPGNLLDSVGQQRSAKGDSR